MKRIIETLPFIGCTTAFAFCFVSLFSSNNVMFWSGIAGVVLMYTGVYWADRRDMKKRRQAWEETGL